MKYAIAIETNRTGPGYALRGREFYIIELRRRESFLSYRDALVYIRLGVNRETLARSYRILAFYRFEFGAIL